MLDAINNLRTVAELCRTKQALPEGLADWLADAFHAYLELEAASLNEAFGLRNGRGGVPWHVEDGIRKRDAALRELCERHFQELNLSARAEAIHRVATCYEASSWRFDREREPMPDNYRGTLKEQLWLAFKSGATMPLSTRQLRTILAVSVGGREASARRRAPPASSADETGKSARVWSSPLPCSLARGKACHGAAERTYTQSASHDFSSPSSQRRTA